MKKRLVSRKIHNDNRGMSLVEVLVAMIIFSIAGVAFLQSFTYATNNNRLAKEKQHALVLAQSMMETVKAYGIEQMDDKNSTAYTNYTLGAKQDPVKSGDSHIYSLKSVNYEGYKYDVKITATESTGANSTGQVGKVHMPSSEYDAEYLQPIEDEQKVVLEKVWAALIATEMVNPGITEYLTDGFSSPEFLDKSLIDCDSRVQNITINFEDGNYKVEAQTSYSVRIAPFTYVDKFGDSKVMAGEVTLSVDCPVKNVYSKSKLAGVYLYYFPAYKKVAGVIPPKNIYDQWLMCESDVINIYNNLNFSASTDEEKIAKNKVNVYLFRQRLPLMNSTDADGTAETKIQGFEAVYKIIVNNSGTGPVWLYANANRNIYDGADQLASFSAQGFTGLSKSFGTIHDRESSTLLYDVKVEVLKENTENVIFTLDGSANEK